MKKVKLNDCNDLIFSLKGIKYTEVLCPVKKGFCNRSCAWFDIEEDYITDVMENGTWCQRKIKAVTCKGTPIAELIEE